MKPVREILTTTEVSEWLRIPKTTLYELCGEAQIPCAKIGRHWRFDKEKIHDWFQEHALAKQRESSDGNNIEADLIEAKEHSEAANQAKRDFLANLSHELRTPLGHIIGFTEILVDKDCGELNETQEEYLNDTLQSARHLLSLINDMLNLSMIEAGDMALHLSSVHTKNLIFRSLDKIKEEATIRGIQLVSKIADIGSILADEDKLLQVLNNLLSNALKFTSDGGKITLSSRVTHCSGSMASGRPVLRSVDEGADGNPFGEYELMDALEISVSDTGIGILSEDIDRIFGRFEQADNAIYRTQNGIGLGLSLSRALIKLHGGIIKAESQGQGKGSRFHVFLPVGDHRI